MTNIKLMYKCNFSSNQKGYLSIPSIFALIIIVLITGSIYFILNNNYKTIISETEQSGSSPKSSNTEVSKQEITKNKVEVLFQGIKRPHGIGVVNGEVLVSSETDKKLYKIKGNNVEVVATLDFAHDIFMWSNKAYITAVFNENRIVEINDKGEVKTIINNLSGPNGITLDKDSNTYYVSNYISGTVLSFGNSKKSEIVVKNLKGPAGMAFDSFTKRLFITNYHDSTLTIVRDNIVLKTVSYPDLKNIETLSLDTRDNLRATAVKNGKGVVVTLKEDGTYETIFETDLPAPLVGYFTEFEVYLVSPNDPQGRILKVYLY